MQSPENESKKILREKLIAMRQAIPGPTARAAAQSLAQTLLLAVPEDARVVACYRAIRGEIDLSPAMEALAARGHRLCLPVASTQGEPLIFRAWKPNDALIPGTYGIEVPAEEAEILTPDVIITPLLAFDADGARLGYGAGYYDRTIQSLREAKKPVQIIGAAYSIQLSPGPLPAEEHDQCLDAAATERSVIRFS